MITGPREEKNKMYCPGEISTFLAQEAFFGRREQTFVLEFPRFSPASEPKEKIKLASAMI
jgi:hypothetical protein